MGNKTLNEPANNVGNTEKVTLYVKDAIAFGDLDDIKDATAKLHGDFNLNTTGLSLAENADYDVVYTGKLSVSDVFGLLDYLINYLNVDVSDLDFNSSENSIQIDN